MNLDFKDEEQSTSKLTKIWGKRDFLWSWRLSKDFTNKDTPQPDLYNKLKKISSKRVDLDSLLTDIQQLDIKEAPIIPDVVPSQQ
jgi:hypothetical protein